MKKKSVIAEFWQYVMDASSLINIEQRLGIKILETLKGALIIPEKVAEEVAFHPKIRKVDPLRMFVLKFPDVVTRFTADEEQEYLRMARQPGIDPGEASAMAIALKRRLPLVIDEKETRARGKANNHGIKTLGWQDFVNRTYDE